MVTSRAGRAAAQPGPGQEPRRLRHASRSTRRASEHRRRWSRPCRCLSPASLTVRRAARAPSTRIAEWQLPNGMIPWFPGGHADPWNHVEAAMALALGGRRAEAERAYDWLRRLQRPDGSWHQYYLADSDRAGQARRQRLRLRRHRRVAPLPAVPATAASSRRCGRWSSGPSTSCSTCRRPRGEILWARHADGTPWSFALLTGSSSHLPQPALRHRPRRAPRPRAARLGAVAPARLAHVIRPLRDARRVRAEAPLGDGLVLPGARRRASAATTAAARLDARARRRSSSRAWACAA